jgi:hypothetical protein
MEAIKKKLAAFKDERDSAVEKAEEYEQRQKEAVSALETVTIT